MDSSRMESERNSGSQVDHEQLAEVLWQIREEVKRLISLAKDENRVQEAGEENSINHLSWVERLKFWKRN